MQCTNPLPLKSPASFIVAGASGSGKTHLVSRLLQNAGYCFEQPIRHVYYCYSIYQESYAALEQTVPGIVFHKGLPNDELVETLADSQHHDLIIIDDLARESSSCQTVENLYVRQSHHYNISVMLLTQNLFHSGRGRITQSCNTQYYFLMRNPASLQQIATFARQRYPGHSAHFMTMYTNVTRHPRSDVLYSIRTGLFPGDDIIVFQFP